jgi:DinB superfamily
MSHQFFTKETPMQAKEAIKNALQSTQHMLQMYLGDLSDADLLVRPVPAANHIAWQLGHLIHSECMLGAQTSASYPELPAGWKEQHSPKNAATEPPRGFATKAEYLNLFNKVREATLAQLARVSDADLDKPTTGEMADFAPTLGALFLLVSNHDMMHAGQFTVVRRKLGKPVLF